MKSYDKGRENAQLTIGNTLNEVMKDRELNREQLLEILMYLQGVHDGYADFLSKYTMTDIIDDIMPPEFGDDMRVFLWDIVYPMTAMYTTAYGEKTSTPNKNNVFLAHQVTATLTKSIIGVLRNNLPDAMFKDHLQIIRDVVDESDNDGKKGSE